jgi:hypothetical protein
VAEQGRGSNGHEWARTMAYLLTPLGAILGVYLAAAGTTRSTETRFVEVAIGILQAPPSDSTRMLRDWATKVVNKYSEVKLSDSLVRQLRDSLPLSVRFTTTLQSGEWLSVDSTGLVTLHPVGPTKYDWDRLKAREDSIDVRFDALRRALESSDSSKKARKH